MHGMHAAPGASMVPSQLEAQLMQRLRRPDDASASLLALVEKMADRAGHVS
jgi:hypothetical protein